MCIYIKYSIYLYNVRKRPDCKIDWKIELTRKIVCVCVRSGGLNKLQQRDTKSKIQAARSLLAIQKHLGQTPHLPCHSLGPPKIA